MDRAETRGSFFSPAKPRRADGESRQQGGRHVQCHRQGLRCAGLHELRLMKATPHVAQNTNGRRSAIDGRTTRHSDYAGQPAHPQAHLGGGSDGSRRSPDRRRRSCAVAIASDGPSPSTTATRLSSRPNVILLQQMGYSACAPSSTVMQEGAALRADDRTWSVQTATSIRKGSAA